jgi:hypothetical protein
MKHTLECIIIKAAPESHMYANTHILTHTHTHIEHTLQRVIVERAQPKREEQRHESDYEASGNLRRRALVDKEQHWGHDELAYHLDYLKVPVCMHVYMYRYMEYRQISATRPSRACMQSRWSQSTCMYVCMHACMYAWMYVSISKFVMNIDVITISCTISMISRYICMCIHVHIIPSMASKMTLDYIWDVMHTSYITVGGYNHWATRARYQRWYLARVAQWLYPPTVTYTCIWNK